MSYRAVLMGVPAVLAACSSKGPPPDFAPDPGLVANIAEIRMTPATDVICPGQTVRADYEAVLRDGTVIPFSRSYDEDRPPALHVVFLHRYSRAAVSQENGDWSTDPDPLMSAMNGFELRVEMKGQPELFDAKTIAPEYSCVRHAFRFVGAPGRQGGPGFSGPDVLLRLGVLRSPFYERLLVLGIEVGDAPPFFVFQDAEAVPPADWFVVESAGGPGGRGAPGGDGAAGAKGTDGCPGGRGGAGGAGGNGGAGGPGGPGGPITIIVPTDQPFLAGLVDGRSPGGRGGSGGSAGKGGAGGAGGSGTVVNGRRCADGAAGPAGRDGAEGPDGPPGSPGVRPRVITVSPSDVFGNRAPQQLRALIDFTRN